MTAKEKGRRAARSPWLTVLARVGFLSRALTYTVIAVLAFRLAFGYDDGSVDKQGALEAMVGQPLGRVLIGALAAGFIGYALWRLGRAAFPTPDDRLKPSRRLSHLGSGLLYVGIFVGVLRLLTGTSGDDRQEQVDLTAAVLALPLGRWLLALVGCGLFAAAAWSVRRALTQSFRRKLEVGMPRNARRAAVATAVAGLFARAVVLLLIGAFLLKAAWEHDATQSVGLDGALRAVAAAPWGGALLCVLAVGVLARGAFSAIEARYRKTE